MRDAEYSLDSSSGARSAASPDRVAAVKPSDERRSPLVAAPATDDREAWALASSVANDGLWYLDTARDELRLSPRALEMLGYAADEPHPPFDALARHVDASQIAGVREVITALLQGKKKRFEIEMRVFTSGGEVRWMQLRGRSRRGRSGEITLVAGSLTDIDHRKRAELALRDEMRRDPLTGLANRAAVGDWLTARIARAANAPLPHFAVLFVDLDRFKIINDSLGHAAGDALLIETAKRLSVALGPADLLARVGGDEFVILLDAVQGEHDARRVAEAVHTRMRERIVANHRDVFTSMSVGVRVSGNWSTKPSDLLRDADVAMYHAKRHGGARTVVFDQAMFEEMVSKFRVQSELHRALHEEEFGIVYQPIFLGDDMRLCGFEALARWDHPSRGRLSAGEFVNEANESGLIVQIGRWIVSEACRQLADWERAYPNALPLTVAVNLCDREIMDPEFASSVEAALQESGLRPSRLVLEMTEGVMMTHMETAVPALQRLRALGVQIQLDDFGKGYSSLSALRRMPLTAIKIDRSFITGIVDDEECRAIVGTIAAFARALGLDVVAEGVETRAQARVLAEMGGFRYVQGHYFGRPVGSSQAEALFDG
jgi:diguanylate cyclase (GGDEF)-like protein/PAS domain S-box-containing protein